MFCIVLWILKIYIYIVKFSMYLYENKLQREKIMNSESKNYIERLMYVA